METNKLFSWDKTPLPDGKHIIRLLEHSFLTLDCVKSTIDIAIDEDKLWFLIAEKISNYSVKLSLLIPKYETHYTYQFTLKVNLTEYIYVEPFSVYKIQKYLNNQKTSQKFGI